MSDVLLYINAGGPHGAGHFWRSYDIAEQLINHGHTPRFTGSISDEFKSIISSKFDLVYGNIDKIENIIIDAVSVTDEFQSEIIGKNKVILISPISNSYDYATHLCLREPLSNSEKAHDKKCFIDPYFAFSGCAANTKTSFQIKDRYNIGVCISGSKQYVNVSNLLSRLLTKKYVEEIKVISNEEDLIVYQEAGPIEIKRFTKNIWEFLENIDIFVTGDGIMLYEAIYRGIPTLSFCRDAHSAKNKNFADKLFINVQQNDWYNDEVFDVITDVKSIQMIIENISSAKIDKKVYNLVNTILKIIEGDY
ncbi:hypothetical protein LSUCC1028_03935 [Rhodobacterales bacterium LSUCC1028]|nr:hypothetical protein [Rhodobacterales bacterium LSUCC1028]